ncbi:MAG: carbon monoxide dehydrogenase subunit G [Actinomycetota bacterium]|nr:carbon monoxide dehydrogenase subunit G [Actinomycetota bacterium]
MKVAGETVLHAPVEKVWSALLDPAVLVATIPGCERLEATGDNAYAMTVTAGVASIKGTYAGTCSLSDLRPHESLVLTAAGSGAPGTVGADVLVSFTDLGDGTTGLAYAADAVVGGMIGGVGQRMLASVSKRLAGEFFGAVDGVLTGATAVGAGGPAVASAGTAGHAPAATGDPRANRSAAGDPVASAGMAYSAPQPDRTGTPAEFLKGVAVGAGLVAFGVLLGSLGRGRG